MIQKTFESSLDIKIMSQCFECNDVKMDISFWYDPSIFGLP